MIPTGKEDTSRSYSLVDVNTLSPYLYTEVSGKVGWGKFVLLLVRMLSSSFSFSFEFLFYIELISV